MKTMLWITLFAAACGSDAPSMPDGGGSGLPMCSGKPIESNGTFDVDLQVVHVTGNVTLAGAPLPPAASGALEFVEESTKVSMTVPLAATYDVSLAPGTYTIQFVSLQTESCSGPAPCNTGPFEHGISLTKDGVLDLDIPVVHVTGAITMNHTALPTTGEGGLSFALSGGKPMYVPLASSYATVVLPGSYIVSYFGTVSDCSGQMPCNSGPIHPATTLSSDGVLDLDIPAVHVTGSVTLAHGALPPSAPGNLSFAIAGTTNTHDPLGGLAAKLPLAPSYSATLLAGTYDVGYDGAGTCDGPLPCNAGTIKKNVSLTSSGVLDVDVPVVKVTGTVTLNSVPIASPGSAMLSFAVTDGGIATIPLAQSYSVFLFPGTYTVGYDGTAQPCSGPLPCNAGPVRTGASLTSNGVLAIDIKAVSVSGQVTLDKAALPTTSLAQLSFAMQGATTGSAQGEDTLSGAALIDVQSHYSVTLLVGTYTIGYAADGETCMGPFPCNSGALKTSVSLTTTGVLDVDIPAVTVSGRVTLARAPLPTTSLDRGDMAFALNSGTIGRSDSFGTTGDAHYAVTILAGRYILLYEGNNQLCDPTGAHMPPCSNEIVAGCP